MGHAAAKRPNTIADKFKDFISKFGKVQTSS